MGEPVILEAVRTPIGKRNGALRAWRPDAFTPGCWMPFWSARE
jgi:acetyl-CoA acetyltransferase